MRKTDPYLAAMLAAENVVKQQGISTLPVDPVALAKSLGITVIAKPASAQGVSGMLLRHGNAFGIAYATHIHNIGFQNFSVSHELGHYFLPGHIDAVLSHGAVHESHAGFGSGDRYEMESLLQKPVIGRVFFAGSRRRGTVSGRDVASEGWR